MITILLLNFIFAITFVLAKAVVAFIKPVFFTGIRMILSGLGMIGYLYWKQSSKLRFDRKNWFQFFQIMLFGFSLSFCGEFWAIQYLSAAKVSLLFNLSPFITSFFAYMFLSERLTLRQWIGLTIGFLGFIPILATQESAEQVTAHIGFFSVPELVLIGAVAAAAYGWVVTKQLLDEHYAPFAINGISMLGGGVLSLLASMGMEGWSSDLIIGGSFWYSMSMILLLLISLIFLGNVISWNMYTDLLKKHTATFLSFSGLTIPLFTAILDWMIWGQIVSMAFMATMIIVSAGLYLFYQDELKQIS